MRGGQGWGGINHMFESVRLEISNKSSSYVRLIPGPQNFFYHECKQIIKLISNQLFLKHNEYLSNQCIYQNQNFKVSTSFSGK